MLKITEQEFMAHRNEFMGFCLSCDRITTSNCEPDATNYRCEECDHNDVFGIEEAMLMGFIDVI